MFKLIIITPGGTEIDICGGGTGGGGGGAGSGGGSGGDTGGIAGPGGGGGSGGGGHIGGGGEGGGIDGVTGPAGPTEAVSPGPRDGTEAGGGFFEKVWDDALSELCPPPGEELPSLELQSAVNERRDELPFGLLDEQLSIGEFTPPATPGERSTAWLGQDVVAEESSWDWVPGAETYGDLRSLRVAGHTLFPGEANTDMRHAWASMVATERHGEWTARLAGVANEYQGFFMHDLTNMCSRLTGRAPWAASFQDLVANERGINEGLRRRRGQ